MACNGYNPVPEAQATGFSERPCSFSPLMLDQHRSPRSHRDSARTLIVGIEGPDMPFRNRAVLELLGMDNRPLMAI